MAGAIVQAVAGFAANALSATFAKTIAATAAGSVIVVKGRFNTPGATRTISSNGTGTWETIYDSLSFDGEPNTYFICRNPQAGTTQVTLNNNGTNSHFTIDVIELSGIDTATSPYVPANHNDQTGVTAWTSSSATLSAISFCLGFSSYGNTTATSIAGSGFTAITGSGYTSGNNINTAEGDTSFIEIQASVAAGSKVATGTWSSAVNCASYIMGLKEASGGGGGGAGSCNRLLLGAG